MKDFLDEYLNCVLERSFVIVVDIEHVISLFDQSINDSLNSVIAFRLREIDNEIHCYVLSAFFWNGKRL